MKAQPVPKHVSATMHPSEVVDLIVTLRAAVRELENLPESIPGIIAALEAANTSDLPPESGINLADDSPTSA